MRVIMGLLIFLFVLVVPWVVWRVVPRVNVEAVLVFVFFIGLFGPMLPFYYLVALEGVVDGRPFIDWVHWPLGIQRLPGEQAVLLLFGVPISAAVGEVVVYDILVYTYFISAFLGNVLAMVIHARRLGLGRLADSELL